MTTDSEGPGGQQPPERRSRIGDAERQAAVETLSDHYVAGRLELEEFNQRSDAALRARTSADLAALFTDLPADPDAQAVAERPSPSLPRAQHTRTPDRRGLETWIGVVQGLLWPVMIISAIFLGLSWYVAIGVALVGSMVLGQVRGNLQQQRKAIKPPDDPPEQLPPGRPPSS